MKTLNLEIKNKAVNEFIDSLNEKGILSNFIEQYCENLLKGYVLVTPEEKLAESDKVVEIEQSKEIKNLDSELDNILSEEDKALNPLTSDETKEDNDLDEGDNGGYFELNEEDLDISDIDFDDDDYDDVEDDDEEDGVMFIPPVPTEKPNESVDEGDSTNTVNSLEVSDREFLETVMTKLDRLLNIAESGGFSGSRVAPLTFPKSVNNSNNEEEDNVVDTEPSVSTDISNSVCDLIGELDMEKVIQINNKLSGR